MKSWDFSRVLPLWLSILILILMPVFRLFRQSGFYFLPHGIQVSSFMSVLIFLSIDWNEKLHFSFYPSIVWLPGAFRLWVTCLNRVPLQCCRTFSRHQILHLEQISFGELHSLEVNCTAADTVSIPLFSRPNISRPCWITSRPWSSEKLPGGITKPLRNGGTLKWKEHAVFVKKHANQNPYAFVFRQQIEKIWLHGIKNTWIEWFTSKFMLDSEMKHEH